MSEQQIMINEMEEEGEEAEDSQNNTNTSANTPQCVAASRRDRRKAAKKERRKRKRKELAEMARLEEEARLDGVEEQLRLEAEEEQERLRFEKELREFEERERKIMEEWERRKAQEHKEEEERRRKSQEEEEQAKLNQVGDENEVDEDGWEYVEEGPPEIIWQGNEIIVKKKKVRVKKQDAGQQITEDPNRPTSNPLPPQSEVFADYRNTSNLSAQQLLQNVAQETPNFGTEQDKAHCPFHLKTGACRFGSRCSRIHFYPDKSCTLLMKNMYNGPGLSWEQDEGLESTDEEVVRAYEEFYEDVHTEFLKFGEIINFKVCRNGSPHLRGNVYVHFKSLDSAVLAYQSINGRYFAGKQVQCEFVGVTKWKVAICGEFMKSKLQACSRGMTCNFIHCFRNPGGDYEWADWDKPPPRYWLEKMGALFGYSDEPGYEKLTERESPRSLRNSSRNPMDDADRYHSRRSQSREVDYTRRSRNYYEDGVRSSSHRRQHRTADRKHPDVLDDKQYDDTSNFGEKARSKNVSIDMDSDMERLDKERDRRSSSRNHPQSRMKRELKSRGKRSDQISIHEDDSDIEQKSYNGDCSDDEREGSHFHTEQSPTSHGSEEFEDKSSKRRHSAHKRKRSRTRDHMDRRNGAADHDSEDPSDCGRSYRYSDSSSRYRSRKDIRKSEWGESKEQFPDHVKRSERKRDNDKRSDSESGIQYSERKKTRLSDCQIDEETDVGDRWEPDEGD